LSKNGEISTRKKKKTLVTKPNDPSPKFHDLNKCLLAFGANNEGQYPHQHKMIARF
jgi:hypothetical protein